MNVLDGRLRDRLGLLQASCATVGIRRKTQEAQDERRLLSVSRRATLLESAEDLQLSEDPRKAGHKLCAKPTDLVLVERLPRVRAARDLGSERRLEPSFASSDRASKSVGVRMIGRHLL